MKCILNILILFFFINPIYSQKTERPPYPNNFLDFGIGIGPNYGNYGTKTVIGYKGNGLLLGVGVAEGLFAYQLGLQGSYKWFFGNFCYGTVAAVSINSSSPILANGLIINGGGRINILRNKKVFIELGAGYAFMSYFRTESGDFFLGGPRFLLGIGFRLFDTAKKEKDNIDDPIGK